MYVCENCGKGILRGNSVSHAKNRTKRIYLPSLHSVRALVDGRVSVIRVCTKCLRIVTKAPKRDLTKIVKKEAVKAEVKPVEVKEVTVEEKKEAGKKTIEETPKRRGRPKKTS